MSKTISLTLKPIGRVQTKQTTKRTATRVIPNDIHKHNQLFADQEIPSINQHEEKNQNFVKKSQKILFSMIEDPRKTSFAYKKFLLMQKTLLLLTFVGFFLALIRTQVEAQYGHQQIQMVCYFNSIATLVLIFCIFMRYLALFQLKIHQKKVFVNNFAQNQSIVPLFFMKSTEDIYYLLLQVLLVIPHSNSLLIGKTVSLFQSYDQIYLIHQVNDIMSMLSLLRIYIILRSLVNVTIYSSPRSSRLCQQNGVDHNLLYSIKCILNEEPLRAIFVVFLITVMFLGVGLKLSEGLLTVNNPTMNSNGFQQYINCFWCVFITMGTIGYGDYYPKTFLGRSIIFATALTGVVLSSLLIVSLSAYLQMQASQSKSHITLMRLNQQQTLKSQATQALVKTIQLFKKMTNKKQQRNGSKLKSIFNDLKRKVDLVKIRAKKVKCLVDTDNILQQMNRLFQILKDNLRDIYQNQVIMKKIIQKIKIPTRVNRSVKLSFAKEMQRAIQKK